MSLGLKYTIPEFCMLGAGMVLSRYRIYPLGMMFES